MTYSETLDYLFKQLPMYQREGKIAFKKDLKNILAISGLLGNPQENFKSVHIAGTNGKGSTAHMLSSILQEAGYKTGLYTSPHLKDFRERIRVNGLMIPEPEIIDFVEKNGATFESIQPSFFEWTVALAFDYFKDQEVDIAVIETGLGGRLDSTNILNPELSIITNIGYDHMDMLGDTLDKIAFEKAGIIKKNTPVVIGYSSGQKKVFQEKAKQTESQIIFADEKEPVTFKSDLLGRYQVENINTVYYSCQELLQQGWKISESNLKNGFEKVVDNTGIQGRWQIIEESPKIIFETAHNEEGFKVVMNQLIQETYSQAHFVLGFVKDKSISKLLKLLPKNAKYYFCQAKISRSLDVHLLALQASEFELIGEVYNSVSDAYNAAKKTAKKDDLIYLGGSNFVVAEAL